MQYALEVNGRTRQVVVHRDDEGWTVSIDGRTFHVDAATIDRHTVSLLVSNGTAAPKESYEVTVAPDPAASGQLVVRVGTTPLAVAIDRRRRWGRGDDHASGGPQRLTAPMPGKIVRVLVKTGEAVRARQPLVVVEAMKMENELRAAHDGTIAEVHAREGASVDAGALLVVIR